MRVNLSVAIVYMAGSNKTGDSLGLEGERTFDWSDKQQDDISFFGSDYIICLGLVDCDLLTFYWS